MKTDRHWDGREIEINGKRKTESGKRRANSE